MALVLHYGLGFDHLLLLLLQDLNLIDKNCKVRHDVLSQQGVESFGVFLGLSNSLDDLHFEHVESLSELVQGILVLLTCTLEKEHFMGCVFNLCG